MHADVGLEGLRIDGLEVLELGRPSKRTDDVDVHAILAPLVSGDAGEAAEAVGGENVSTSCPGLTCEARGGVDGA